MSKRIVVIGSSFAGLTAAVELKHKLGTDHEVVVVSKTPQFVFMPSLIWVPFGLREAKDISFDAQAVLESKGVRYIQAEVTDLDLEKRQIRSRGQPDLPYDYLVIATGPKLDYPAVPGLGPRDGHSASIFSLDDALAAKAAFERFVEQPGPVVIGAVQGASCFGAAYEFLFNMAYQLRKRGIAERAPLTYVSAEPFLAHFGIGGFGKATPMTEYFFKSQNINYALDAEVKEIVPGEVRLTDGRSFPFAFSMMAPAFLGVDAVRARQDIATPRGFVKVDAGYRTAAFPEVYACGVAVQMDPPTPTKVPCGVPKTGYLSEEMAKVVAHNIAADIRGEEPMERPAAEIDAKCVLDAGNTGIIMSSDHFLEPRTSAWLIPGPEAHWAKLAFEKYFLFTRSHGWV